MKIATQNINFIFTPKNWFWTVAKVLAVGSYRNVARIEKYGLVAIVQTRGFGGVQIQVFSYQKSNLTDAKFLKSQHCPFQESRGAVSSSTSRREAEASI